MRTRLVTGAFALLAVFPAVAIARKPSPAQIQAAVARAERSPRLWATVNICNRPRGTIGIRGQMPALPFPSWLVMHVHIEFWATYNKVWVLDSTDRNARATVGFPQRLARGVHQNGATFAFMPTSSPYRLRGTITFEWRLHGKTLGQTSRTTTGDHRRVDGADPPHFSAATCTIK